MTIGRIHSYETLGGRDGPGLRTVIFLQGCPYRCGYCHNPDTWCVGEGEETTVDQVMARVRRFRPYYGTTGGVTFSGGEPLLQAGFVAELCELCAVEGIHTAIDTAGLPVSSAVASALQACKLVILDIKHPDPERFRELTGADPRGMRETLAFTKTHRKPTWIRQVIVPGWNDTPADMEALAALVRDHPSRERVELLPYHTMGCAKWDALGRTSPFADTPPMPADRLAALQAALDRALS
jgi:pyruvate formate lyase activating enzyme